MSNIKMLHRIFFDNEAIHEVYKKRGLGLSYRYHELISFIENRLNENYTFGSLEEAISNPEIIHLSFDDGYIEHLRVAKKLKEKYNFRKQDITFCVNLRNATQDIKLCTDVFYQLLNKGKIESAIECLYHIGYKNHLTPGSFLEHFDRIKKFIFSKEIKDVSNFFECLYQNNHSLEMDSFFLNASQVLELSELFSIASHSVNHVYLDELDSSAAFSELENSKTKLESIIKTDIVTFCYPDGRNTKHLQILCKKAGYQYALSIKAAEEKFNPYSIPRCFNISY